MQKKYVKVLHLELVIGYSTVFTYIIGKLGQHLGLYKVTITTQEI